MTKRSGLSSQKHLLPLLPIDSLQWTQLGSKFDSRTVRRINRITGNLQITTWPERICFLAAILERELKLSINGAELSTVFGRKKPRAYEMIGEHIHQLHSPDHLHSGCPRLVEIPWEDDRI
jgi:hypothetical protein